MDLLGAYLLVGDDELKKETALKRLKKHLDEGTFDFNYQQFDAQTQPSIEEFLVAVKTPPMMTNLRIVVFFDVDKAALTLKDAIIDYLAKPTPGVVLAMTAEKLAKNTKLYKAIAKLGGKTVISCESLSMKELPNYVRDLATTHGKLIDYDAARLLISLTGQSTLALNSELKKLADAVGPRQSITHEDVRRLVARIAEVKPWDFTDAFCARNQVLTLQVYQQMQDANPVGLIFWLAREVRLLITIKCLVNQGKTPQIGSEVKIQPWKIKQYLAWQREWKMSELIRALEILANCDVRLKSEADKETIFVTSLIDVLAKDKSHLAAY